YFLAYSLLGRTFGLQQLFWLDFYYTGIFLLLCWQYYRLARAVGLGERASLVFVILQALLFGNNVFSFYRYYGISSSIYAQLGAVALTRLGIEVMSRKSESQKIGKSENSRPKTNFRFPLSAFPCMASLSSIALAKEDVLWPLASGLSLALFIAFNHGQGIGIAALGLAAVATWRLMAWKRSTGWILLAAAILLSLATIRWYPRHPAIDQMYRPQGYLNAWYGFNIFSLSSPAGDRMLQIVGVVGLVNFAAGLLLLRRNHPVGWLTVMPVIALSLPCVAIPFAGLLARHDNPILIVTFQRMFFAIPVGLAMVCLGSSLEGWVKRKLGPSLVPSFVLTSSLLAFGALTAISPNRPSYHRFWHSLAQTPADLRMESLMADLKTRSFILEPTSPLLATCSISAVLQSTGIKTISFANRAIGTPIANSADYVIGSIADPQNRASRLCIPPALSLYTSVSLAGQLSGHWPSQQVASDYAAGPEIEAKVLKIGGIKLQDSSATLYWLEKISSPSGK
ncbi:MAG TPA: hypothetical protein VG759_16845, partial [Candidatus Angelobacter sp.]|nr:hypothetical protein [Candidatus Angelobacter sp.]